MNILIILGALFLGIILMVMLVERFAKPAEKENQEKYNKVLPLLVFIMLVLALGREVIERSSF